MRIVAFWTLATSFLVGDIDGRCPQSSGNYSDALGQSEAVTLARVLLEGNAEYASDLDAFYCTYHILKRSKPDGRSAILNPDTLHSDPECIGIWLYSPEREFLEVRSLSNSGPLDFVKETTSHDCAIGIWQSTYFRNGDFEGRYAPDVRTLNLYSERERNLGRTVHNPLSFWKSSDGSLFPATEGLKRLLDGHGGPVKVSVSDREFGLPVVLEIVEVFIERTGARVYFGFDVNSGFSLRWYRLETRDDFVETLVNELRPLEAGGWFPTRISRVIGKSESELLARDMMVVTEVSSAVDWDLGKTQLEKGTYFFEPARPLGYRVLSEPEVIGPADLEAMIKRTLVPRVKSSNSSGAEFWLERLSLTHWIAVGSVNVILIAMIVISWRKMIATPLFAARRPGKTEGR
jgi:hypothetical protein